MSTRASGGWKVSQPLQWKKVASTPHAAPITALWATKYEEVFLHDRNKFLASDKGKVESDIQDKVRRVYDHLASITPTNRGGTATGPVSPDERSDAAYIWKVFKRQCHVLWSGETHDLSMETAIAELRMLIEETDAGTPPCTAARNNATLGKAREVEAELGQESEVDELESEMDAPTGEGRFREGNEERNVQENGLDEDEPWMDGALTVFRGMVVERASQESDRVALDDRIIPPASGTARTPFDDVSFQTPSLESMQTSIQKFIRASGQKVTNPLSGLQKGQVDIAGQTSTRSVSKRKEDSGGRGAKDPEKTRSAKRVRSSELLGVMGTGEPGPGQLLTQGESPSDLDSIAQECTNVGAIYLGLSARSVLGHPILTGMFAAADLAKEHEQSTDSGVESFVTTIRDLDSIATRL
ncbi:hypothetical protein FRC01_003423 [Tulasnella sp. 417]|nr:hypothetical protein FRC01_003423 [Tulasnella sp. 417]